MNSKFFESINSEDEMYQSTFEEKFEEKEEEIFLEAKEYFELNQSDSLEREIIKSLIIDVKKVGEGFNAHLIFIIETKTSLKEYEKKIIKTERRFNDFIILHDLLTLKYRSKGTIIPPLPHKDAIGATKIKIFKEETISSDFIFYRKQALQRFLNFINHHPILRIDPSYVEFLEKKREIEKTRDLSSITFKYFSKFGAILGTTNNSSFDKNIFCQNDFIDLMPNEEEWYLERKEQLEMMEHKIKNILNSTEQNYFFYKDFIGTTKCFGESLKILSHFEKDFKIISTFENLSKTYLKIEKLNRESNKNQYISLLFNNNLDYIYAAKSSFSEYERHQKQLKDDSKSKNIELKTENKKIPKEINFLIKNIKNENKIFDEGRKEDYKSTLIFHLSSLLQSQEKVEK